MYKSTYVVHMRCTFWLWSASDKMNLAQFGIFAASAGNGYHVESRLEDLSWGSHTYKQIHNTGPTFDRFLTQLQPTSVTWQTMSAIMPRCSFFSVCIDASRIKLDMTSFINSAEVD